MENKNSIKKISIDDNIKLNAFRDLPTEALSLLGNMVENHNIKVDKVPDNNKENFRFTFGIIVFFIISFNIS